MRIRNVTSDDTPALHTLLRRVSVFEPHEVRVAEAVLEEYLSGSTDYRIQVAETHAAGSDEGGRLLGFVCHGHNPVTDAVHDIYWIAVDPGAQRCGTGRALLLDAERAVRQAAGRAITIETSSRADYRGAQAFYQSCGYACVAEIPDFYKPGEAMRTYMKTL